ncbi:endonuclease/exonuclease/phosphatase family protein [Nocardia huaxiensis]|uniref:endonuclease/exonuclease/phosphatase family protein n=1 Tax=Nocardia huaxiensis TaxID=2755382 RepID=UPI001E4093D4|nr:endonuclease/exonuclease/phosphatase family protein [Nocardia huaxiensis]UFS99024.1 endonuclease/exonuclease/phosphatase family protein [Nocardia huaxiensis]
MLLAVAIGGHQLVPDVFGLGVAADTAAPWLGLLIPVLAVLAILCRSPLGALTAVLPLLVWAYSFGSWWAPLPRSHAPAGAGSITVVSQNLFADNGSPIATARVLAGAEADVVAVQELAGTNRAAVEHILDAAYPYNEVVGTVALWSRYPTSNTTVADVGLPWERGLRTHITTPRGELVVYVVHLPSIRPGDTSTRNHGLAQLSRELTADPAEHVLVAGDFNTPSTDRHWSAFAPGYRDTQRAAGSGPGLTWPSTFPIARLDHLLARGLTTSAAGVLDTPGTDHRGITATVGFAD